MQEKLKNAISMRADSFLIIVINFVRMVQHVEGTSILNICSSNCVSLVC